MYFDNQNHPPQVVVVQQEPAAKERTPRKMSQPILLSLVLAYTQRCIDLNIEAEEFTAKFIHIYSNLKTLNDGNKRKKRRKTNATVIRKEEYRA